MNEYQDIIEENKRLQSLVEEYRQKEIDELRKRLVDAEAKAEHYQNEAQRNADVGRQIASQYETKITELRTKLEIYERTSTRPSRPNS